jgi:calcineurin-binding protein cabin-1
MTIIGTTTFGSSRTLEEAQDGNLEACYAKSGEGSIQMEGVWHMLYNDSLSALGICVEGDLKHFHKARYMLAQGLYRRGGSSDLQRAKEELSFCFKSSRSSFTINMWEIDGMVKKGRRKTPGLAGNKKALEVNLPESSRKFITCIRKYLLFYLRLLEETEDVNTLERAFNSLRSDKRVRT